MFIERLKLWWSIYWVWVLIGLLLLISVLLPAWYMVGMEENTRRYLMAMNLVNMPFQVIATLIFVGLLYIMQFGGFSSLRKRRIKTSAVKVHFSDVIGLGEAKREAWETVQLIKDRTRLKAIGGKILRGVLMVGPPGCGKTMLAKAIATEAGVPFLSCSGSEFVEVFVGVGASRMRRLFGQARAYARAYGACIIFIDELEVIGRHRILHDAFGGGAETNSTQNQLLVEMDGLNDEAANVVVIGATNAGSCLLDQALRRPGRFDREIFVGKPNLEERGRLFEHYLSKVKFDPAISVAKLARKAVSKTPAEIENIVKEAALIAARKRKEKLEYKELSEAVERIELGIEHRLSLTPQERERVAYHEVGHLVVLYLTHPTNDVFKISIRQRGSALGVVHSVPREEMYTDDSPSILADIRFALGGYAGERLKYGVTSNGVSSDFSAAMNMARGMVWRFGMGPSGLVGDFSGEKLSEQTLSVLNQDTQKILQSQLAEVEALLKKEWQLVEVLVRAVLEREELDFDEITDIFTRNGKPPRLIPGGPQAENA